MNKLGILGLLVFIALALAACADGPKLTFAAAITSAAEVPAPTLNGATPSGSVTATLNASETALNVNGTFAGLTGPATAAHIHGPAAEGATASPVFNFGTDGTLSLSASGTFSGTWNLTAAQVQDLRNGLLYINIHTAANAPGEIRGQLK